MCREGKLDSTLKEIQIEQETKKDENRFRVEIKETSVLILIKIREKQLQLNSAKWKKSDTE